MNAIQILSSQPWVERLGWILIHFLWQGVVISTLYAAVRRCIARSSSPNTRYILACVALGAMMAAPLMTWGLLRPSDLAPTPIHVAGPIFPAASTTTTFAASVRVAASGAWPERYLPAVVAVWLIGAIACWLRLIGGWMVAIQLRSRLVRPVPEEWRQTLHILKSRIRVSRPVRLLSSSLVQVPIVVGWLRPIVLVPVGALAGLPPEQMEALLLHELAHIRRHDYLVNILQSVVEALLFYHPAVWWISGHIRNERELCCDDVAVSVSGDALTYARALVELESSRPAHLQAALAANGGSVSDRIGRLLGQPQPAFRTLSGPGVIAGAILLIVTVFGLFGQSAVSPRFDVASVKPNMRTDRQVIMIRPMPGGRLVARNSPLRVLMQNAYAIHRFQILGGPNWVDSDRFDIEAKAGGAVNGQQIWLMLQALLEERFILKTHRETRELPVYALAMAKNGAKLQQPKEGRCIVSDPNAPPPESAAPPCGQIRVTVNPSGLILEGGKIAVPELIRILTMLMGRKVIDKTGVTDAFDVHLEFINDDALAGLPGTGAPGGLAPPAEPGGASIFSALPEQLGLRLESIKGPVEVLVIDHVEKPSAN